MQRWEYRYVYLKTETRAEYEINNMLNEMGSQGWELMKVVIGTGESSGNATIHGYYFKRLA